jgi:hypothetical protein
MSEVKTAADIAVERATAVNADNVSMDEYRMFKEYTLRHIQELTKAVSELQKTPKKKQQK